jgi:hypothetical protein
MRAYELFQREGCVHGRHVDHWLLAESELLKEGTQLPPARVATTRPRG